MIKSAATMAMFMLRLSGLLSLDKNFTDTAPYGSYNVSELDSSHWPFIYNETSWIIDNQTSVVNDPWKRSSNSSDEHDISLVSSPPSIVDQYDNPVAAALVDVRHGETTSQPNDFAINANRSNGSLVANSSIHLGVQEQFETTTTTASAIRNKIVIPPIQKTEEMIEVDELMEIVTENSNSDEMRRPPLEVVASDFEYYDFSVQRQNVHVPAVLTSHSLVSPVPFPIINKVQNATAKRADLADEISNAENLPRDNNEQNLNLVVPATPVTPPRKVIRPVMIDSSGNRNNPYPYGPMFLPGYSGVTAPNLPVTIRPTTTRTVATTTQEFRQPIDEYEYNYESYDYKESVHKVQTDKPTVLFHFDGPGYAPEVPSTEPPPVRAPTPSDPWDCSPRCPNYTLEDWNSFYEIRKYPQMTWLSTIIISKDRVLAELEGYMRLQDYFFGLNDRGLILNLSVPFITQIKQNGHPGVLQELNDYTISLHVPPGSIDHGYSMPAPISNEVLIDTLESKTLFVTSFEVDVWEVTDEFLEIKADILMSKLRSNGEAFIDRYYYLASYSRPELYQPVYYEIWVYATSLRNPRLPPPEPLPRPRMPPLSKMTQDTLQKLCRGIECPSFEVVRSYRYGIQKRRYFDVVFASVSSGDCYFSTLSVWKGFMPLHLYKHGINSHMEVIEATRPIAVVRVAEDSTSNTECPQNLTMSLFLPRRLHSSPPVTGYTAPRPVVITALEDVMVYSYTVGGYLMEPKRVRQELSDFKYRLSEFGVCYKENVYYIVIYDFISRYHGRQNEIWIVAENCRATRNG